MIFWNALKALTASTVKLLLSLFNSNGAQMTELHRKLS